jgi:hypothetical protein
MAATANAGELTEKETKFLADQAMWLFHSEKFSEAYKIFLPYWPVEESTVQKVIQETRDQWPTVTNTFGKSVGFEHITTQRAGKSLIKHLYIQKFSYHAIRWQFVFYKPNEKWLVNSVSFDDKVGALLE